MFVRFNVAIATIRACAIIEEIHEELIFTVTYHPIDKTIDRIGYERKNDIVEIDKYKTNKLAQNFNFDDLMVIIKKLADTLNLKLVENSTWITPHFSGNRICCYFGEKFMYNEITKEKWCGHVLFGF